MQPMHQAETDNEQLRRRNRELSILNDIAQALNAEVDLNAALETTLGMIVDLFSLHTGWIWLISEETDQPYLAASHNRPPALVQNPGKMDGSAYCYCLDTYTAGDMQGAANIALVTCTRLKGLVEGTAGLRCHASIPLYAQRKKLGLLNVVSPDWQELAPDELRLLHTVGEFVSMAIQRARLHGRATQYGITEERNRLAREIHDTLAQGLTAITLQLETADALLDAPANVPQAQSMIRSALNLARENLDEARRSVMDLRAAPLEGRTLTEAVRELAQAITTEAGLTLHFSTGDQHPLTPRIEIALYRIAQEALNNIVQHAHAHIVTVHLASYPQRMTLCIADDGRGFDPDAPRLAGCFGLIGMNERVRLLGGALDLSTSPQGTEVNVSVPLN